MTNANKEIQYLLMLNRLLYFRCIGVYGFPEIITVENLGNNPGIIPLRLDSEKVCKCFHTFIHMNDLILIINYINKPHEISEKISKFVEKNSGYSREILTGLKFYYPLWKKL